MPTGLISVVTNYLVDGVTPTSVTITTTAGSLTLSAANAPGAIPSAVETAANTLLASTFPGLASLCHCFSVSPFDVAFWFGEVATAPPNAVWWQL